MNLLFRLTAAAALLVACIAPATAHDETECKDEGTTVQVLKAIATLTGAMDKDLLEGDQATVQALQAIITVAGAMDKDLWGDDQTTVQALQALDTGKDVQTANEGTDVNAIINDKGQTALRLAASEGDTDKVRELLSNGADVNARDDIGITALHEAAYGGHTDTVQELLKNGADVNAIVNADGKRLDRWTPATCGDR